MFTAIASLLTGSSRPENCEANRAEEESDLSSSEEGSESLETEFREKCNERLASDDRKETDDNQENFSEGSIDDRPARFSRASDHRLENTEEDGREQSATKNSKETRDGSKERSKDELSAEARKGYGDKIETEVQANSQLDAPEDEPKSEQAQSIKFFKRKLFDVDQSLVEKFDLHLKSLKHRSLLNEKKLFGKKEEKKNKVNKANKADRPSKENSEEPIAGQTDKQKCKNDEGDKPQESGNQCRRRHRCKTDKAENDPHESDKNAKQSDKLANKSKKAKSSSRFSKWLYNKFKHSDGELSDSDGCAAPSSERNSQPNSELISQLTSQPSDLQSEPHSELHSELTSSMAELHSEQASERNSELVGDPSERNSNKQNVNSVNRENRESHKETSGQCKAGASKCSSSALLKGLSKELLEELINDDDEEDASLIEQRINQLIYTSKLYNLRRKLLKGKQTGEKSTERAEQATSSGDSSDDECDCCKDKLKKLKSERLKLKNQLRRKKSWKKCFVFLNPIFLLAVFFYLLYSELTAVRAELISLPSSANQLTSAGSGRFTSNGVPRGLLETAGLLANLRQKREQSSQSDNANRGKRSKELAKEQEKNLNNLNDKLDNKSDKSVNKNSRTADRPDELDAGRSEDGNVNEANGNEANQNENSENSDFASLLNQPLRIPISKRNFFGGGSYESSAADANRPTQRDFEDALLLNNLPQFKVLAILPTTLSPQLSRHLHRAMALYFAYTEGLVSGLELSQYFDHLRYPNGAPSDLSSSLHHLQVNATITPDYHHHNEKIKFLFHTNHSELNFEDHLFSHLIQRIHHRNRTQHYSESNSLYPPPDLKPIYHDPLFASPNNVQQHHLNEKQLIEHFIQTNRKRLLRPSAAGASFSVGFHPQPNPPFAASPSSPSSQFAGFSQAPEIQLSLLPLGNSSSRLISSLCDSVEIQRPTLILSLVDPTKNYYLEMLARISDVPMLTLTSEYEETASLQKLLMEVINRRLMLSKFKHFKF